MSSFASWFRPRADANVLSRGLLPFRTYSEKSGSIPDPRGAAFALAFPFAFLAVALAFIARGASLALATLLPGSLVLSLRLPLAARGPWALALASFARWWPSAATGPARLLALFAVVFVCLFVSLFPKHAKHMWLLQVLYVCRAGVALIDWNLRYPN